MIAEPLFCRVLPRLLLAMALLLAPLLAGPAAQARAGNAAAVLQSAAICHADGTPDAPGPQAPFHHAHGCALCPACQLVVHHPAILPPDAVPLPLPRLLRRGRATPRPFGTGPPRRRAAASPQGPPPPAV